MGLIEFLLGWKRVKEKDVHKDMVQIINKKLDVKRKLQYKEMKYINLGRNFRGEKILPDFPGITIYTVGKKYKYKIKDSPYIYFENHGYGGHSHSGRKIFRKLK